MLRPASAQAAGLADLPPCQTAGQACVVVKVVDGGQQVGPLTYTTAGDLIGGDADVSDQGYAVPNSSAVTVTRGTSVNRLITSAGIDLGDVTFVEVDGPDGYGRHLLTRSELAPPSQDDPAPVLYPNPAGSNQSDYVNFVRAERGGSDNQLLRSPDLGFFQSDPDAALEIVVHRSGQALDVTATATPVAGSGGRTFALSSTPGAGSGDTTTWVFPDGTSTDPTPTYTVPDGFSGSVPLSVAVEAPDGSFGWGTATVQVGSPPSTAPSPSTSPGTGGHGGGHTGSTHGHHGGSGPGSGHGSGHGGTTPTPTPTTKPSATASATTAIPTPAPTVAPTLPTALYPPTERPSPAPSTPTPSATTATPTPTPTAEGSAVAGLLLTAADPRPPSPQGQILDVPSPSASAAPAVDPPFRVASWVWLAAGSLALLVAGAASESTRVRRRLRPLVAQWSRIGG